MERSRGGRRVGVAVAVARRGRETRARGAAERAAGQVVAAMALVAVRVEGG
jgi:hypothetical protein